MLECRGMPILYHTRCVTAVDSDALVDEAIVSAYTKRAAATSRYMSAAAAMADKNCLLYCLLESF